MNALQILGLIALIASIAGVLAFLFQAGNTNTDDQPYTAPEYTQEELDNIKAAEQLYDKDLRPIVPPRKQPTLTTEELPDRQPAFPHNVTTPTAKVAVAKELIVNEPEFVPKVAQAIVEKVKETKSEFPIDKSNKKRKSHAKGKK